MTAPRVTRHSFSHAGQVINCHVEAPALQPLWIAVWHGRGFLIGPAIDFDFSDPRAIDTFEQRVLQQLGLLPKQ
jgi:hypothetical protein